MRQQENNLNKKFQQNKLQKNISSYFIDEISDLDASLQQQNENFNNLAYKQQMMLQKKCYQNEDEFEKEEQNYTEVYVFGSDKYGQLGIGKLPNNNARDKQPIPKILSFNLIIKEISCGDNHSAFITSKGQVYTMGNNDYGKLGIGNLKTNYISHPSQVSKLKSYICQKVSCGSDHTVVITKQVQLGIGSEYDKISLPIQNQIPCKVKKIASGQQHSLFLSQEGNIYSCGYNKSYQLGLGHRNTVPIPTKIISTNKFKEISAGNHSAAISEQGQLYIWGTGIFGKYENPMHFQHQSEFQEISVGGYSGLALDLNGQLYSWGQNSEGQKFKFD
ncbi:Regulator of chromosome condensation 1/beta-lactamase-inhibitor protein II [Pseudocohnilembus persalinus]|uniref:Regulator of chromosome condensation 1/beta-lactamase-inhibitor protein II n=1 Tax=Pseudocohnilembus persalinus TaxID=266149 RepID=A0A0V0R679_PSEPJ|nr:Regulator of chromosome condensation 1/beta-lactamase-inhibitor protein II [Pseudocohnilembus persalinus]|eukprot:KRX09980.1 Regulator of chromosome condensation 1/beta-lactamase-inhibitor protein II [Pseudocohnilembus persalinus]